MTQPAKRHHFPFHLLTVFFVLSLGIASAGYVYHGIQKADLQGSKKDELTAVADLKVNQIMRWRRELLADAQVIMENRFIASFLEAYVETPAITKIESDTLGWMTSLKTHYDYRRVAVIDSKGNLLLCVPAQPREIDMEALQLVPEAYREKRPLMSDLYRTSKTDEPSLSLIIPILSYQADDMKPIAFLVLTIDPEKFLFPLIQSWPTPSATSETLLVRRDKDHVLFLNHLRHSEVPALTLRAPLTNTNVISVMAIHGHQGSVEGSDYRGKAVLATIQSISDSPWYLISKIDKEEIYAPLRNHDWLVISLVGVLIMGAAVSVGFFWSQQNSQFFRNQYESELKRHEIAKRYEFLTQYANDSILLEDLNGKILEANERALLAYGYSRDEMLRLSMLDISGPGIVSRNEGVLMPHEERGIVFETVHRRKDGSLFPVEVSSRVVQLGGVDYVQSIVRDITERKHAELAMREAQDELERRVEERTAELLRANEVLQSEIVERRRVEKALRKSESMLKLRSAQLLLAQETERKRLALDLHDSIGQSLSAIKMGVLECHRATGNGQDGHRLLEPLLKMIHQSVDDVRRISMNLRPSILDDLGILATIDWFTTEMGKVHPGMRIRKDISVEEEEIPEGLKIVAYRILQESFNNIAKHSGATLVNIFLTKENGRLEMKVTDNGNGFDPHSPSSRQDSTGGLGLSSMRERAELSGGEFTFVSRVGEGTEVTVSWPGS